MPSFSSAPRETWPTRRYFRRSRSGGVDADAFARLCAQLRYVGGDYKDPATYERLRQALNGAARPLHYLAIPPSLSRPWCVAWKPRAAPGMPA